MLLLSLALRKESNVIWRVKPMSSMKSLEVLASFLLIRPGVDHRPENVPHSAPKTVFRYFFHVYLFSALRNCGRTSWLSNAQLLREVTP